MFKDEKEHIQFFSKDIVLMREGIFGCTRWEDYCKTSIGEGFSINEDTGGMS